MQLLSLRPWRCLLRDSIASFLSIELYHLLYLVNLKNKRRKKKKKKGPKSQKTIIDKNNSRKFLIHDLRCELCQLTSSDQNSSVKLTIELFYRLTVFPSLNLMNCLKFCMCQPQYGRQKPITITMLMNIVFRILFTCQK